MENNKCECEEIKTDKTVKDNIKEDNGCDCGGDYVSSPEVSGCGCGEDEYPDLSVIANPCSAKVIAEEDFMREFENYAHSIGIKSIGYTLLTPELMITDTFIQYPNTIVLTMEMDKKIIETAPGAQSQELNDAAYEKLGNLTYKISDYLRENGFATEIAHPYSGIVNFSSLAQKAGLGFIGKSGLLITPDLGPRQKISAIFVSIANLPIKECNEYSWILDYCDKCGKCIKACPEEALVEMETCCGDKEFKLLPKLCIGCSQGCTYCIENCPFDEKGYDYVKARFDKMNIKLLEKKSKK